MKEEIVNLLTAKSAKEKGFDEPCGHYYILDFQNFKANGILNKTGLPDNCNSDNIYQFVRRKKQPHLASAPTQSLLQKWIREVHNIDVFVDCIGSGKYFYTIYVNDESDTKFVQDGEYKFEVALEEGLFRALKLI